MPVNAKAKVPSSAQLAAGERGAVRQYLVVDSFLSMIPLVHG